MKLIVAIIPILILLTGVLIYRFNGRKELLKMDLVQFIYAFILTPTMVLWVKTVVFLNLKKEQNLYSSEDMFLVDTIITTISLIVFGFVVIHSLTKTFSLKKQKDPLIDIFEHSEYFHLWLSHLVTYSGGLFIMLLVGLANLVAPIILFTSKQGLIIGSISGVFLSLIFHHLIKIIEDQRKFDLVMKFQVYISTVTLMLAYLIFRPEYETKYTMFWCSIMFFLGATVVSRMLPKTRARQLSKKYQAEIVHKESTI